MIQTWYTNTLCCSNTEATTTTTTIQLRNITVFKRGDELTSDGSLKHAKVLEQDRSSKRFSSDLFFQVIIIIKIFCQV